MTWEQMLLLLLDMKKTKHTSMDQPVCLIVDGTIYNADIIESLTTGGAYIIPAIADTEEDDG